MRDTRDATTVTAMRIMLVAGARPNFMKIAPVLSALDDRDADTVLVHTGQHYDPLMSGVFFDELGMRPPDHHLEAGSGSHAEQTTAIMLAFEKIVDRLRPDIVVVPGDVNGTMACALVGAKAGALVAHVEAGLRSRDWSMPEEINRVVTDRVSDLLFAPSPDAVDNLRAEGYRDDQIHLVGNVMVDTLVANVERAKQRPILQEIGVEPGGFGVVTLHRPSNVDDPATLASLLSTLEEVAKRIPLVLPAHPRAADQIRQAIASEHIHLVEPLGYLDFIGLESQAAVILTDSGGVQEEATVLGIPCLTLRENTERPITVTEGTNRIVGRDNAAILQGVQDALDGRVPVRRPDLWDGAAGQRIAETLLKTAPSAMRRPTELDR